MASWINNLWSNFLSSYNKRNRIRGYITNPLVQPNEGDLEGGGGVDYITCHDLVHSYGYISCSYRRTRDAEPKSIVEIRTSPQATFIGLYEGHGSYANHASSFLLNHLFGFVAHNAYVNRLNQDPDLLSHAIQRAELNYEVEVMKSTGSELAELKSSGACVIALAIAENIIFVGNAGDAKSIMYAEPRFLRFFKRPNIIQLNVDLPGIRDDVRAKHPGVDNLFVNTHPGPWLLKGLVPFSKSVGDFRLKPGKLCGNGAVLSCDPYSNNLVRNNTDKFIVIASRVLWEHLSNEDVCHIVNSSPRQNIARRLMNAVLEEVASKQLVIDHDFAVVVVFNEHKDHFEQEWDDFEAHKWFTTAQGQQLSNVIFNL